jgi:hypothetical protein
MSPPSATQGEEFDMSTERTDVAAVSGSRRAMDIINAVLAVWLFVSPWALVYGTGDAWNTWIVSAIIFLTAMSALSRLTVWQERVTLVLGAWMFISPWVFGFSGPSLGASWNQWIVGALIFLISGAAMAARRNIGTAGMTHAHGTH